MDKKTLVASVVLVALAIVLIYFIGRAKKHTITFKAPSGKITTLAVE